MQPVRDNDWKSAAKYLENLQRSVYESLGLHERLVLNRASDVDAITISKENEIVTRWLHQSVESHSQSKTEYEDFKRKVAESMREQMAERPTPYETAYYAVLSSLDKEIQDAMRVLSKPSTQKVLFGTLPTGRVNGMAVSIPNNPYVLIVFEDGLFGFANLMAKAVARAFPLAAPRDGHIGFSVDPNDCRKEVQAHPESAVHFFEAVVAYLVHGNPLRAKSYLEHSAPHARLGEIFRNSMELFVLAHEYGHVVNGHLNGSQTKRMMVGSEDVSEIETNWRQEIEADTTGLELLLAANMKKGFDVAMSFWGGSLLFGCIEILERAVGILTQGNAEASISPTHPPTAIRRESLKQILRNSSPPGGAEGPIKLAEQVEAVIQILWSKIEPALYRMHEEKIRVAPMWQ